VHDAAGPQTFLGVSFGRDGSTRFYDTPRLVPTQPSISDTRNE
jgi:hypothetical protein